MPNTHHQKNRQPCSEFRGSPSSKATKPELQDRIPAAVPRNQAEVPALPASSTLGLVLNSFPPPASRQPASPHFPHGPCVPVSRNHPHECIHPFPPEIRLAASCPWCLKPDLAKSPQLGRGRNPGQEYSGRRSRGFPSPPPPPPPPLQCHTQPEPADTRAGTRDTCRRGLCLKDPPSQGAPDCGPDPTRFRRDTPQTQDNLRRKPQIQRPSDPRNPREGCPDAKQYLPASGRLQTLKLTEDTPDPRTPRREATDPRAPQRGPDPRGHRDPPPAPH